MQQVLFTSIEIVTSSNVWLYYIIDTHDTKALSRLMPPGITILGSIDSIAQL